MPESIIQMLFSNLPPLDIDDEDMTFETQGLIILMLLADNVTSFGDAPPWFGHGE